MPLLLLAVLLCLLVAMPMMADTYRPRVIVATDIGDDHDDEQSMVRFLLYANEFDIEAIIASGNRHKTRENPEVNPHLIHNLIDQYAQVRDNLLLHKPGYPSAEQLHAQVMVGQAVTGGRYHNTPEKKLEWCIGPDKDTAGSQAIIDAADRDDPRPLWVLLWGGAADLAQAVYRIREDRGESALQAFFDKVCVYQITRQDITYDWLEEHYAGRFRLHLTSRGFSGIMYRWDGQDPGSEDWVNQHIRHGHGPLGAAYTWVHNKQHERKYEIKEGDTPSFLYLLDGVTGLGDSMQPAWGGWGGRFATRDWIHLIDSEDQWAGKSARTVGVGRWKEHIHHDFAARADWCVLPFDRANHNPVARLASKARRTVAPGEEVVLDARGSTDPDGDALHFTWSHYPEAGGQTTALEITGARSALARFTAPAVDAATDLHIILTVQDDGTPPLVGYQRAIIRVDPAHAAPHPH